MTVLPLTWESPYLKRKFSYWNWAQVLMLNQDHGACMQHCISWRWSIGTLAIYDSVVGNLDLWPLLLPLFMLPYFKATKTLPFCPTAHFSSKMPFHQFMSKLRLCSANHRADYSVTWPVIGWAWCELTPSKRQKTGPGNPVEEMRNCRIVWRFSDNDAECMQDKHFQIHSL